MSTGTATAIGLGFELDLLEDLVRDVLRDCRSEADESDDEDETGFESSLDGDSFSFAGARFLRWRTGCSSFSSICGDGGAIGAHDASELIGLFIHVATLCVSSLLPFLALFPCRFFFLTATGGDLGNSASNIEESSLPNATHSSFALFKTMVLGNQIDN